MLTNNVLQTLDSFPLVCGDNNRKGPSPAGSLASVVGPRTAAV
jgi:hypothetical protein